MRDRPPSQTTEWQEASVVLDIPQESTSLHFGVLLSGAGAVDLAQPRFEKVDADVPVTAKPSPPLPDEPQALNFGPPAAT
jgi:AraC family transcriptional regulator